MITKTQKADLGLGLPEKKKKKKKVVKEPETQYSVLNRDNCFANVSPIRATSPSKNVVQGQTPEMPLVKKKKKKKGYSTPCEEQLEPETTCHARQTEKSPSPRKEALGHSEFLSGEKKKRRKSSLPPTMSHGLGAKTSPDPRQNEEAVTRVGKKLKKHKKEKKAQDPTAFSVRDPWFCSAGDGYTCSVGREGKEQAAAGQKRKQGSARESSGKGKKKKKVHQEGDSLLGHSKMSGSTESSGKGSRMKPVKIDAPEYIPLGDGPKAPAKKKMKSKKKVEQPVLEEVAVKRKKKKKRKKDSGVAGDPWKEDPDPDLEVVLEKKGNMDEAHIDQVRRKALQEEIDRESGKTEASETRKWTGTQFGQWDTAGFENEEQKLKFLKLMGGFKNLSPSFNRPPSMAGRPNMALNKKAADTLQQNLQRDYDRAMSWKYSRGAGLGFSNAADKIFYIDRNASKSIRFED
ncbi:lysine-rich nucleolar protein 1 [Nycticebus coucang]|uniref:lysine-rich nucleolar protein 1 n=1 Tax=Nycticebus coucang TaxID=9470 RepID=UPI00234CABD3|nr:lysine-rich nucleolar protein 1 [Nycticebus coucang]XP_053412225.1 lysine-rich nucleolar protein 1 [Nycticebus coucang]XP_053412226.1 lysine-rich nucleolar protein 1 [Nycticebus coucang]XP_053412227.1 lysine-rich nucleolar protein 1 [Nycticebus coucang]